MPQYSNALKQNLTHQREYGFTNKMTERKNAYFTTSDFLAATTVLNFALKMLYFHLKPASLKYLMKYCRTLRRE